MGGCHLDEDSAGSAETGGKTAGTKGTISHYRNPVLFAGWDEGMFNRTLLQVIQHLVAGYLSMAGYGHGLFNLLSVEVADSIGADLSL